MRPVVHEQQGDKCLPGVQVRKTSKLNRSINIGLRGPGRRLLLRRGAARGRWLQMALGPFRDRWEISSGEKWGEGYCTLRREHALNQRGTKVKSTQHLGEYKEVR